MKQQSETARRLINDLYKTGQDSTASDAFLERMLERFDQQSPDGQRVLFKFAMTLAFGGLVELGAVDPETIGAALSESE